MIKLKDFRETIGAPPFCKHAGSPLLPNAPNIPNCGLVLQLARYRVSRALEASLLQGWRKAMHMCWSGICPGDQMSFSTFYSYNQDSNPHEYILVQLI